MCRCPECWELLDDGVTCAPKQANINVQCLPDQIFVEIDRCVFGPNVVQIGFDQSDSSWGTNRRSHFLGTFGRDFFPTFDILLKRSSEN